MYLFNKQVHPLLRFISDKQHKLPLENEKIVTCITMQIQNIILNLHGNISTELCIYIEY